MCDGIDDSSTDIFVTIAIHNFLLKKVENFAGQSTYFFVLRTPNSIFTDASKIYFPFFKLPPNLEATNNYNIDRRDLIKQDGYDTVYGN